MCTAAVAASPALFRIPAVTPACSVHCDCHYSFDLVCATAIAAGPALLSARFQSTDVDHLSLHVMVRALDTPDKQDLRKLQLLKDELVSVSSSRHHCALHVFLFVVVVVFVVVAAVVVFFGSSPW